MIERSNVQIVAVDYTKLDRIAFSHIAPVTAVSNIVTNSKLDKETHNRLKKAKANLVLVD